MTDQPKCPECGREMEIGFIPDATYGSVMQSHWHAGIPEDKRFLGLKMTAVLGVPAIKHDPRQLLPITAYRCTGCGALKFYARNRDVE